MRLLQKTNRIYTLFATLLFLVGGIILFIRITGIIEEEAAEQLLSNEQRIALKLKHGQPFTELSPVIEITRLGRPLAEHIALKDTIFYDEFEAEVENFLQLTSIRNINGQAYRLVLRQMLVEPRDYLASIGLSLAVVLALLLVCLAVMNRVIYRKLWRPFYQALAALKGFSVYQNSPLPLKESKIQEFTELNTAITKLTGKVRSDFRALKEFSENASHEMQTPLAVIQTKLDELLQDAALSEQQASRIQVANTSVKKLARLNQTLLLLTKIENRQFIYTETVDVRLMMERQLKDSEDFIQDKGLRVSYAADTALTVTANPALVEILVSNLLRNAIKHNIPNGCIDITLTKYSLHISNSGKPLAHAPAVLFERFSKADPSSGSLGLGLAIVKTICTIYGWQIKYEANQCNHLLQVDFSGMATSYSSN